jgi:C4-dicarboxylate transporter DctQ subunit
MPAEAVFEPVCARTDVRSRIQSSILHSNRGRMAVLKTIWQNLERWIAMFFIAFLAVILFVEVLFRYILYESIGWISEISSFMFVWFIYLSISYITGKDTHIRVQILDLIIPKHWIRYVDICMNFLWLGFNCLMVFYGIQLVLSVIRYPFRTPILDISMAIPYSIIPLAFGLMTIRLSVNMYGQIVGGGRRQKT